MFPIRPVVKHLIAVVGVAACLLCAAPAHAHDTLELLIGRATRDIAADPRDAARYLTRGELYRADHQTRRALLDYARALRLDPQLIIVYLARGQLLVDAGRPRDALSDLDRYIATADASAEAHVLRARARAALSQAERGIEDYDTALRLRPSPDWAIERARLLARARPRDPAAASRSLDEAMIALGFVPTLQLEAIALDRLAGRLAPAMARIDRLLATTGQVPAWLALRGDLLVALGRRDEARRAFTAALAAIDRLSPARQSAPRIASLRARLRRSL